MKILLVEDDVQLANEIATALRREHFAVDVAGDGEEGLHLGATESFDVAVLDLGLPKLPGASVLRAWRKAGQELPVLILTARDGWTEKVEGFKAGADDYLTKPFRIEELIMRCALWQGGQPVTQWRKSAAGLSRSMPRRACSNSMAFRSN